MAKNDKPKTRKIRTLQFGEINVEPVHIFKFKEGLLGFENLYEFVLISDEETVPFKWLISLENPEIGFPLLSPWHLDLTYDPGNNFDLENEVLFVVVTLGNEKGKMTANMKAPVVFNIDEQSGKQIILPTDKYSPNYVIQKKKKK